MKKKYINIIAIFLIAVTWIFIVWKANLHLTEFIDNFNIVCAEQKFHSADEAVQGMEASKREQNDSYLDYCPPYEVVHAFECEENTIVLYSYCYSYDGVISESYAVRILKHNEDGTLSFDSGFADFYLNEPDGKQDYYYFTNINTTKGNKSISFLYLPKDSDKEIYVDGGKAEKILVSDGDNEFYLCFALTKKDTFLSDLFTPVSERHKVEVR